MYIIWKFSFAFAVCIVVYTPAFVRKIPVRTKTVLYVFIRQNVYAIDTYLAKKLVLGQQRLLWSIV